MANDLTQSSLVDIARALRVGDVSSVDLLDRFIARVEKYNPGLNAVVTFDYERAREAAKAADAALERGHLLGPLHGVPMTLKDTFEVAGLRTTAGAPEYAEHFSKKDSVVAKRLRAAGAVIFAKTNVPYMAGDLQTFNEIFGTTNNPWDQARTPGGSSGGAAAAVAAGLTSCEVGSDIGGSIRVPSSYCGVFGHKPSWGIVPSRGHIPGPPDSLSEPDINVCGPIGRCPDDLRMLLEVLVGADENQAVGWQCRLPGARHTELRSYRVAAWLGEDGVPMDDRVSGVLRGTVSKLRQAGVPVADEARPEFLLEDAVKLFWQMLIPIVSSGMPSDQLDIFRMLAAEAPAADESPIAIFARGAVQSHHDWMRANEQREKMCAAWAEFFEHYDVLLLPVTPVPAIPHTQEDAVFTRTIEINGKREAYINLFNWLGPVGVARLPSTVVPVGLTDQGLPVGVQVVSPYLEDYTALGFAAHLAGIVGSVGVSPGF